MKYLIDTCVISELRKPEPHPAVLGWFGSCRAGDIFISSLSMGELQYGISVLPDSKKKNDLMIWFNQVTVSFGDRVLPVTREIGITWGNLRAEVKSRGRILPVVDGLLAATAITHDLIFITRNTVDIQMTGVSILNPWQE
jgi:predicted nucleic acid-binding protein